MQISQLNSSGLGQPPMAGDGAVAARAVASEAARSSGAVVELPAKAVHSAAATSNLEQLKQATEKINQAVKMLASNLTFSVDEDTGLNVVKVIDTETDEVIRQIPSEETLAIAKALDQLQGLLVRDKV